MQPQIGNAPALAAQQQGRQPYQTLTYLPEAVPAFFLLCNIISSDPLFVAYQRLVTALDAEFGSIEHVDSWQAFYFDAFALANGIIDAGFHESDPHNDHKIPANWARLYLNEEHDNRCKDDSNEDLYVSVVRIPLPTSMPPGAASGTADSSLILACFSRTTHFGGHNTEKLGGYCTEQVPWNFDLQVTAEIPDGGLDRTVVYTCREGRDWRHDFSEHQFAERQSALVELSHIIGLPLSSLMEFMTLSFFDYHDWLRTSEPGIAVPPLRRTAISAPPVVENVELGTIVPREWAQMFSDSTPLSDATLSALDRMRQTLSKYPSACLGVWLALRGRVCHLQAKPYLDNFKDIYDWLLNSHTLLVDEEAFDAARWVEENVIITAYTNLEDLALGCADYFRTDFRFRTGDPKITFCIASDYPSDDCYDWQYHDDDREGTLTWEMVGEHRTTLILGFCATDIMDAANWAVTVKLHSRNPDAHEHSQIPQMNQDDDRRGVHLAVGSCPSCRRKKADDPNLPRWQSGAVVSHLSDLWRMVDPISVWKTQQRFALMLIALTLCFVTKSDGPGVGGRTEEEDMDMDEAEDQDDGSVSEGEYELLLEDYLTIPGIPRHLRQLVKAK
ncbi:hypothetical protein HDU87_004198 [Geranomyces variabilis]|uniref:Uncharacterized protein n=1 Tax=Geranomyces variabilis TaxID=109894 RepID=A0AAD5XQ59_9FUNG|nr:hypothetical protein HDU87_004198 [Geranomyces variabilis]